MLIGILQCGHFPDELQGEVGDYGDIYQRFLADQGFDFSVFPVCDGTFPDGPTACDGWLISGSKHGAYEDLPWIPRLEALIRDIRDSQRPLVGICFGHQIIAQALGGHVAKFDGGWAIGRTAYHMAPDAPFDGDLWLNAWHQDQILRLPEGARLLASSDTCRNAVVAYGDQILTMQPHPEFNAPELSGLLQIKGVEVLSKAEMAKAQADLARPVDNARLARHVADFFQKVPA
ncbi:type 1 glutamine amidotransferase [Pseudooceanicola nitratireducens]|uniref:type 1 glutamine amidotransferase n=1 Tax=Pseudooceanicola nitratireducens TaxID=517719 RepID=UPI0031060C01